MYYNQENRFPILDVADYNFTYDSILSYMKSFGSERVSLKFIEDFVKTIDVAHYYGSVNE